ncbi:MAG: hypothetical protein K8W52_26960 [Deltaproteobacteria bacterium]|nr:hypothetical protein [Deltaproteobacteria bacterium]
MRTTVRFTLLALIALAGCAHHAAPATTTPVGDTIGEPAVAAPDPCNAAQAAVRRDADARAAPWSLAQHLTKNFADHQVAWLMKDAAYDKYVVATHAVHFGRCDDSGCYLFAAPAAVIHAAVTAAHADGGHDPAALGKALGLPAANFEGPLRMMTLDVAAVCVRLPVEQDPGAWPCKSADDHDCFKFGGYTSGGIPELMVIDAPVAPATVEAIP